jgi:hypothetical protein
MWETRNAYRILENVLLEDREDERITLRWVWRVRL